MLNANLYRSDRADWSTPKSLFAALDAEFGFTLDVCADPSNAKCPAYFGTADDGLARDWAGVCWMNPPYGRQIARWVEKAAMSATAGCTVACLLPVRSDTRWWHAHVMRAAEVRLLTRRLSFERSNNKAPFPAAVVVFRPGSVPPPRLTAMIV